MGPYAGVDYNLTLCRLQHIYHGQPYARVDFIPQSGTLDLASVCQFTKFFCLLLFEGTFTSFIKDKKSKRSNKTVGIKVFLTLKGPDPEADPNACL